MELTIKGVVVYGAGNSENAYHFRGSQPVNKCWSRVKNVYTKLVTIVSGTDIVAKWTIRPKGGIPKLDTPILSEEDVKDLGDDR